MRQKAKKYPVFHDLLLYFNWFAIFALFLAYSASFISPRLTVIPQIFGLGYPLILVLNLAFVFLWIYLRRKYFLYSLLAVLLGFGFLKRTFHFSNEQRVYPQSFSVLSYNVRYFNVYFWHGQSYTLNDIFQAIKQQNPDFVCFQEFLDNSKIHSLKLFKQEYAYHRISNQGKNFSYGLTIFSKYPVLRSGVLKLNGQSFALFADIRYQGSEFRLINVHFRSVHFGYTEYNAFDSLKFSNERIKSILKKLTLGYRGRQIQVQKLCQLLDTSSLPVVLVGDFNDLPVSYTYSKISHRLKDAFTVLGQGFGSTYVHYLPFLRIDYIFYSAQDFVLVDYYRLKLKYSDHYPLMGRFSWQ